MHLVLEILLVVLHVLYILLASIVRWIIPSNYKSVKNEVCLITGGGSGIGRLMAMEFAKRGATLVLWDINEKGNEETAEMIRRIGGKAFAEKCDVSDREEVYKLAKKAKATAGEVTILINNAGVVFGKDFMDLKDSEVEKTMQVNSLAHMWTVRAFLPSMIERNHGHIVTIASVMGLFPASGLTSYVASKHAAVGFNNALEMDLRAKKIDGVKTTVACPYHIDTGMFSGLSTRFPGLLPPIKPADCVSTIMHAVLTERTLVEIPRLMYFAHCAAVLLPHEAGVVLHRFLGVFEAMDKFVPNRDYQKEAAKTE